MTTESTASDTGSDLKASKRRRLGRNFNYQLSAYSIQTLGEGVVIAALPLLASHLTSDPRPISWVRLATELPWLLLALPGGVIVDRYDRRILMIIAQTAQALLLVAVGAIVALGADRIWMLYVLAFGLCMGDIIFMGASKALIAKIVPSAELETANGRNVTAETLGRLFLGPALGSALFVIFLSLPLWVNAGTYLISIVLIFRIRGATGHFRPVRAADEPEAQRKGAIAEIIEGAAWLFRHRVLRVIVVLAAVSNFCVFMAQATMVLFAKEVLSVGDRGYGILVAAMAIGGVIGGLVSRRVVELLGPRLVVIVVSSASALSLVAIGVIGRSPVVVVALFAVWSAGLSVWNVMAQSLSQRLIPNEMMGRVGGASRTLAFGALPLGALAGGFVAAAYGLAAPWTIGGLIHFAFVLITLPAILRWPSNFAIPVPSGE